MDLFRIGLNQIGLINFCTESERRERILVTSESNWGKGCDKWKTPTTCMLDLVEKKFVERKKTWKYAHDKTKFIT